MFHIARSTESLNLEQWWVSLDGELWKPVNRAPRPDDEDNIRKLFTVRQSNHTIQVSLTWNSRHLENLGAEFGVTIIHSLADLIDLYDANTAEDLARQVYKSTEDGVQFVSVDSPPSLDLSATVEGDDSDWRAHRRLYYPFTHGDWNDALQYLSDECESRRAELTSTDRTQFPDALTTWYVVLTDVDHDTVLTNDEYPVLHEALARMLLVHRELTNEGYTAGDVIHDSPFPESTYGATCTYYREIGTPHTRQLVIHSTCGRDDATWTRRTEYNTMARARGPVWRKRYAGNFTAEIRHNPAFANQVPSHQWYHDWHVTYPVSLGVLGTGANARARTLEEAQTRCDEHVKKRRDYLMRQRGWRG